MPPAGAASARSHSAPLQRNGFFWFGGLPAGDYTLTVRGRWLTLPLARFDGVRIAAGENTDPRLQPLDLAAQLRRFRLRAVAADGAPLADAAGAVRWRAPSQGEWTTPWSLFPWRDGAVDVFLPTARAEFVFVAPGAAPRSVMLDAGAHDVVVADARPVVFGLPGARATLGSERAFRLCAEWRGEGPAGTTGEAVDGASSLLGADDRATLRLAQAGRYALSLRAEGGPAGSSIPTADLGVIEEISSFTQQVNYAEYMAHNLALASEYINGTLLLPGEVFSMNKTTENRDPENGYMEGWVIGPGGIFQKALGGGLSAATTTVWSAAFYAGLEPVEVQAHSIYISRYVPGLEATIAWDGFDMKFRNNTPYGVFITAESNETSMTVRMYSTKMYTTIDAEVGERYGITPNRKIYNESSQCSAQTGGPGFTIDVDRVFYEGDVEVERQTFTTTYRPAPQVVCGAKPDKDKDKDEDGGDPSPEPSPSGDPTSEPTESVEEPAQAASVRGVGPTRGTSGPSVLRVGDTVWLAS